MLVNKSSDKLHEDIKINSNNSTIKGENSWKLAKKWLHENVMKISGFIWNIQRNILVWKYFWPVSVVHIDLF